MIKIYRGLLKLKKVGTSIGLIIPKNVRNFIDTIDGDYVGVKLWKTYTKEFICDKCNKLFIDYEHSTIHDCPHCGGEVNVLKGGNKANKMNNEEQDKEEVEDEIEVVDKEAKEQK